MPDGNGFLDYSTREGQKIFDNVTANLYDDKVKFDGSSKDLLMFKTKLLRLVD